MDYSNLTSEEKVSTLTNAVAYSTPEEIREIYKNLGEVEFTARALAIACRYRGLEHVKALVECGATFDYERSGRIHAAYDCEEVNFSLSLINFNGKNDENLFAQVFFTEGKPVLGDNLSLKGGKKLPVLPLKQRVEIVEYLCENGKSACLDAGTLLYYSILKKSFTMADALKKSGAVIPDECKKVLSEGGSGITKGMDRWYEYSNIIYSMKIDDFLRVCEYFCAELDGKPLHFTEVIYAGIGSVNFYEPELFEFFLNHFNQSKMNKTRILNVIIKNNLISDLAIAAEAGWLKQPRKRDEMIAFASEGGYTEVSAWLLDYKNRTADLAAEQKKAEKKMMRELNAAPDSVSELKKVWSYKKREDGTLVITSYKGNKTEISVPAKIGKEAVTAIGTYAFSPCAPRRTQEQADNRGQIQKITLPDSIKVIEENAFYWCKELEEINVPDGMTEICNGTFTNCGIKKMMLPDSVKRIGESAFWGCDSMTSVNIPESVTEIGKQAFGACTALKEIEVPGSVEKISSWVFQHCSALEKVIIHEGVAEIGREAFSNCTALNELELPASIKKITNYRHPQNDMLTPFYQIPALTLIVAPKSYAEKYCKRNELAYKVKES